MILPSALNNALLLGESSSGGGNTYVDAIIDTEISIDEDVQTITILEDFHEISITLCEC